MYAFAARKLSGSVVTWGDVHAGGDNSEARAVLDSSNVDPVQNIYSTGNISLRRKRGAWVALQKKEHNVFSIN